MKLTTEDFVRADACDRLETWSRRYDPPRIQLAEAMRSSLRAALIAGTPTAAYAKFIACASNPGLDIEGRSVYDIAIHHASMIELIATYLLDGEAWRPAPDVPLGDDTLSPLSFQMGDGRLRRVVLCSTWNALREQEERHSWWTVADCAMVEAPMLVNVIVIGQSRDGFRVSPWTTGYTHPRNNTVRIRAKGGEFKESWKRVRRENIECRSIDWLHYMQRDGALAEAVFSFTVDPSMEIRRAAKEQMEEMAAEIARGGESMRRSACFRYAPCPLAGICHASTPILPQEAGWREKALPSRNLAVVI